MPIMPLSVLYSKRQSSVNANVNVEWESRTSRSVSVSE